MVQLATGDPAGQALLWAVDLHNRSAHLGISLRPAFRGCGLGTDTVRVLCRYGFAILGLQRLQVETLASNAAMIATATPAGVGPGGTLRPSGWVDGQFADEVIPGLLARDWHPAQLRSPAGVSQAAGLMLRPSSARRRAAWSGRLVMRTSMRWSRRNWSIRASWSTVHTMTPMPLRRHAPATPSRAIR